jgi:hypothetical protein
MKERSGGENMGHRHLRLGQRRFLSTKLGFPNSLVCQHYVWQGVAMDSRKFQPGPPCQTLLCHVGWPPHNGPYGRFRGGPLPGQADRGCPLPLWTSYVLRQLIHQELFVSLFTMFKITISN